MNNYEKVNLLLNQVRIISQKIMMQRREKRSRGENYNIFQILDLMSDEVRLHSSFIASLLNPKGIHGQNDKYLKAFMEMLHKKNPSKVSSEFLLSSSPKISVQVEKKYRRKD